MNKINSTAGSKGEPAAAARAQTMPASGEGGARRDEPKKRSFFTMGKKK